MMMGQGPGIQKDTGNYTTEPFAISLSCEEGKKMLSEGSKWLIVPITKYSMQNNRHKQHLPQFFMLSQC